MIRRNHFVASLSPADLALIEPDLEVVQLRRNQVIAEAGRPVTAAYLPLDCILSVVTIMAQGAQIESRTIGRESGHGLLHALGSPHSTERMICQVEGSAVRIRLDALSAAAAARASLAGAIARHAQIGLVQSIQGVACNALHPASARMARWLLMTQDRLGEDRLPLTQEHLAIMVGVQRTTISAVASALQARGVISNGRGRVTIVDREGLRRLSCECYDAIEEAVRLTLEEAPPDRAAGRPVLRYARRGEPARQDDPTRPAR
jgi:CRP-like cAMP-binding protein